MSNTQTAPQATEESTADILTKRLEPAANHRHKDSLFRIIFRDKKELLSLCNALADTDYQNPDDLTITTLEDVLYIRIKNDISFLLGDHLNLYEHQSTFSPNMPFRGFLYMADLTTALDLAINECIQNNVLSKILKRERMVIMSSILSEFDEEAYKKVIREDGYEDGFEDCQRKLLALTANLLAQKRYDDLERSTKDTGFLENLYQEFNL